MSNCPHCGHEARYCTNCGKPLAGGWSITPGRGGWSSMSPLESTAPWASGDGRLEQSAALGASLHAVRKTPARSPSVGADVGVPVLQGLALGAAAGCLAIFPTLLLPDWPWWSPLAIAATVAPLAVAGFIFGHRALLWTVEQFDQDPPEPAPTSSLPAPRRPVALDVTERDEQAQFRKMTRLELPAGIEPRDFYNFARQVVSGAKGLALSDWAGGGRPFSRAKYEALLGELAAAGLVALVNPTAPAQGRKLTRKGRQALMTYCELFETGQI